MLTKLWDLFWRFRLTWWPKFISASPYIVIAMFLLCALTSCTALATGTAGTLTAIATAPLTPAVQVPATIAVSAGVAELLHSAQQVTTEPVTDIWGLIAQIWTDIWWGALLVCLLFWAVPNPKQLWKRLKERMGA